MTFVVECRLPMESLEPRLSSGSPIQSIETALVDGVAKAVTWQTWHVNRRYNEFKALREKLLTVEGWSHAHKFRALAFPPGARAYRLTCLY